MRVVSSVSIDSAIQLRAETALVSVRYAELGTLAPASGGLRFAPIGDSARRRVVDTLRLVRAQDGWRTIGSAGTPRISAKIAMYYFDLVEGARASIAGMAGLDWSSAVRLVLTAPAGLTQLPSFVRDTLTERGCRVLQRRGQPTDNALRGAFFGAGDTAWAVLCARSAEGTILVFSRRDHPPAELPSIGESIPDVDALPKPDDVFIYGCAPSIGLIRAPTMRSLVASGRFISEYDAGTDTLEESERRLPAHDAVNSGDCEGASNIYYWTGRRWVRFPGAD